MHIWIRYFCFVCLATTVRIGYATAEEESQFDLERRASNDILARMGIGGNGVDPCVELDIQIAGQDTGKIIVKLQSDWAPLTVKNFMDYVGQKYYDGTIFHRIIPRFMVQGGAFTENLYDGNRPTEKPGQNPPIQLEANHPNTKGTLAMARTSDPNSATSQFFINLVDNAFLNPNPSSAGYTAFAVVLDGMDLVERMGKVQTQTLPSGFADVPRKENEVRLVRAVATVCPN